MDPFSPALPPSGFVGDLVGVSLGIPRRSTFHSSGIRAFSFFSLWGSRSRLLLFTTGTKLGWVTFSICRNRLHRRGLGGAGEQGEGAACGHRLSRGGVVAQVRVERAHHGVPPMPLSQTLFASGTNRLTTASRRTADRPPSLERLLTQRFPSCSRGICL